MIAKSPYEKNFKYHISNCEKNLINKRQIVTKLKRKELEDKYLILCDENYNLKCQNTKYEEKIKFLLAKIIRLNETKSNLRASSASVLTDLVITSTSDFGSNIELDIKGLNTRRNKFRTDRMRNEKRDSIKDSKENINANVNENQPAPSNNTQSNVSNQLEELKQTLTVQYAENSKLSERNEYLEQQLSQINLKKYIMENTEVNRYKTKVVELRQAIQKMQDKLIKLSSQKNSKIVVQQQEITDLLSQLKDEKEKMFELNERLEFSKSNQRQIEMMKQQIEELKYDKKSLIMQQENLATIIRNAAIHESECSTPDTINQCCDCMSIGDNHNELKDTLIKLKTENAAIRRSQDEMFKKLCCLQDLNDEVTIELERYRPNIIGIENL